MKRLLPIVLFMTLSAAAWSADSFDEHALGIVDQMKIDNRWTGAALAVEAVSMVGILGSIPQLLLSDPPTLFFVSVGAFGFAYLAELASISTTAAACVSLNRALARADSEAQRPYFAETAAFLSLGAAAVAFGFASFETSGAAPSMSGFFGLISMVSGAVTYFAVRNYVRSAAVRFEGSPALG